MQSSGCMMPPHRGKWKFYPWKEVKGSGRSILVGREPSPLPVQLYDTVADIGETKNLAEDYPEVAERLQAVYDGQVAEIEANLRPTAPLVRPAGAVSPERPGGEKKKARRKKS